MSTYHTLCDKKKSNPFDSRFSSFLPVPSSWFNSPNCHNLGNFYFLDDSNSSSILGVYFYDGVYFFDCTSLNNHVVSCPFSSLRNCLLGLLSTSNSLKWKVDPKWFLCDSYKLPPVKE